MKPKVLKTERDHKTALAYVDHLMDQPSTDEAELELWSLLVENYEESHFPIATPDPIEAIRFRLDQAGLHTADLVPSLKSPVLRPKARWDRDRKSWNSYPESERQLISQDGWEGQLRGDTQG